MPASNLASDLTTTQGLIHPGQSLTPLPPSLNFLLGKKLVGSEGTFEPRTSGLKSKLS